MGAGQVCHGGADDNRYWDEERELKDPKKREALILERVQHQLRYAYNSIPFYRKHYDAHGFKPSDVRSMEDFTAKVPVITKKMLVADQHEHPPFGSYLGVDPSTLTRIHGSSGTSGTPTMYGVSHKDWERAGEVSAMALWTAGIRPGDRVQITLPFTLFFGGWGMLQATERIGATAFPTGSVVGTDKQIEFIHQLSITVVTGTPSYLIYLADRARDIGMDLAKSQVRLLISGGEPGASIPAVRESLQNLWGGPKIVDIAAGSTSEMYPFMTNIGCSESEGGVHLYLDENYTEIVDRDDPNVAMPAGTPGATVATHLWRESQPMIRFWMGDESVLDDTPCPCGRTYPRLPRGVFGRIDDMLIIRGANVYPSAVEEAIRQVAGCGREFRILVDRVGALDSMTVSVERLPDVGPDRVSTLQHTLEAELKASLHVRVPVEIVDPGTHEVQTFKSRRVVDNRAHLV